MFRLPEDVGPNVNQKSLEQKGAEDVVVTNRPTHNFVVCVHKAKIADLLRAITVTWSKNLISHSLTITVESPVDENLCSCKIDLKTWQFWGKKGLKSFKVDAKRVDVFWDLRCAKFLGSPEPVSDYYIALVVENEVVLLLGDQKNEALKRTKSRPALVEAALLHKKENVFAKKHFGTRTILGQGKREHNINVELPVAGPNEPEMWITVDGTISIRIMNLHWRFRGNETIYVDDMPIEVYWDVHDWLYSSTNPGHGTFIFRQSTAGDAADPDLKRLPSSEYGTYDDEGNRCSPIPEDQFCNEFCHFLYAWKAD